VDLARSAAGVYNRPDLAPPLAAALARIDRPETLIAVIGEFKKGKSSLINALLGVDIAPVDDDLATAVATVYRHAPEPSAIVVAAGDDGQDVHIAMAPTEALALVREQANPENTRGIRLVEIRVPNPYLESGAVLIDTPGFGGLALSGAGVSRVLLRAVDAVVMVTDASAPLLRPEVELVRRAAEVCPAILLAVSKIDLYPAWRRVLADDEAALAAEGLDVPAQPVSSVLMGVAHAHNDDRLGEESGVPALREMLEGLVLDVNRSEACRRGLEEAQAAIAALKETAAQQLGALEDPDRASARLVELEAAKGRLEHLRGPGARWAQVLADSLSDTSGEADHQFRLALRTLSREIDDELETIDPARQWDVLAEKIRARVGASVDALFAAIEEGARTAERAVVEWLQANEGLELPAPGGTGVPLLGDWTPRAVDRTRITQHAGLVFSGLRGGQGGILTIGMVATLAGITLTTAMTAGIGLVFGGKQILDERRRQLQARRQQARSNARQFIDDLQFETNKRVRDLSRDLQRQLRDGFLELVATRQRTCAESVAAVQAALQQDAAAREAGIAKLRERIQHLDLLAARAAELEAAL
jgi:hypothetical protein